MASTVNTMDKDGRAAGRARRTQLVPFLVLVGVVAAVGILFYQVIRPMLIPLFLAGVIAMLAQPMMARLTERLWGHTRVAAFVMTTLVVLGIVGPLALGTYFGLVQLYGAIEALREDLADREARRAFDLASFPAIGEWLDWANQYVQVDIEQVRSFGVKVARGMGELVYERTMELISDLPGLVVGTFMFLLALYYFLADGRAIISGWSRLSPLDSEHDRIIRDEFTKVCRGVVWATIVAACAQGLLLGLGLAIEEVVFGIGLGRWSILFAILATVFAMVPMVGAAAVWVPILLFLVYQGNYAAAACLLVYGVVIISAADNVIKVMVLRDSASLHPLLVFVCVFGGIHVMGILGIFVGPIVGAVLFALLGILRSELTKLSKSDLAATAETVLTNAAEPVWNAVVGQSSAAASPPVPESDSPKGRS